MHGGSAKFSDLYELQEDIGVGSYSICKRCVHRVSAMDYAVKVSPQQICYSLVFIYCSAVLYTPQCHTVTPESYPVKSQFCWILNSSTLLGVKFLAQRHFNSGQ